MTAASRWIGPRRSRPSWDGERANEGPTAATCEFANGRMATPTAKGGDTVPNRDGPLGTRDNAPDRATQLPPPPRCTGPGAPTATNRHFISVHSVNMTQFTVLVRRLSPKCSQFPSRGPRGRAAKRPVIGYSSARLARLVSTPRASTPRPLPPPQQHQYLWHATPHHTTHRTPHMTPHTHTPPHTPHTLSLPPSPLRHSPLPPHHPIIPPDLTYMYQGHHVRRYCLRYSRPNHSPRVHALDPFAMGIRLATATASSASVFELYPLTPPCPPPHEGVAAFGGP